MEKRYGRFIEPEAVMLRVEVGSGELSGREYVMQSTVGFEPIVISKTTGKRFTLEWHDIVALAVAAGIDEADDGKEG
jgi:hypothetical protein|nr:MAG TPA: hypothetical protein [Caudoviricetes sp.]